MQSKNGKKKSNKFIYLLRNLKTSLIFFFFLNIPLQFKQKKIITTFMNKFRKSLGKKQYN